MIELYYWTTPNGHKITMFLEEAELPYTIVPINIGKGDQFKPEFLKISPIIAFLQLSIVNPSMVANPFPYLNPVPFCCIWQKKPGS